MIICQGKVWEELIEEFWMSKQEGIERVGWSLDKYSVIGCNRVTVD